MSERNGSSGMSMTLWCGLLIVTQVLLIVLKLTKVIDDEWLYICIPSIILGGAVVITILFVIIIKIIDYLLQRIK